MNSATPSKRIESLSQTYNHWRMQFGWEVGILPTQPQHDGTQHIELIDGTWHLVATERGLELSRDLFTSDEALLQQIFIDMTFGAGVAYEFKHRIEHLDCRRMIFAHQLALLRKVNTEWHEEAQRRIAETLAKHPYLDRG